MPNVLWLIIPFIIAFVIGYCVGRFRKSDGRLRLDLSGEGEPVTLDISKFEKMLTAKRITLDFEVVMPKEVPEKEEKE